MPSLRPFILRAMLAAATAAFLPPAALAQEADPDALFKGQMGGTFGKKMPEVMPTGKRIAVAAFRVGFVTDNSVTAQVRASYLPGIDRSGARSSMFVQLNGVDPRTLQAITDKAYADLLAQLAASGREVVSLEQLKEHFPGVKASTSGFTKQHNGQTVSFFAPSGMPLVFSHFESQWGDSSVFDLTNYRKLQEISSKVNAVVISPVVFVNFAKMSSSGNQSGLIARSAETGAELGMSVAAGSSLYIRTDEFRNGMLMKGDEGSFTLSQPIESPVAFGSMRTLSQEDNSGVKGIFDVLGKAAGLANAGGAARSSKKAVADTNDQNYSAAAGDALQRFAVALGSWFRKYPPVN